LTHGSNNKARQVNLPIAEQYARDVISGSVVASKLVIAAAQRHLSDRSMVGVDSPYRFDENAAQRVIDFFQFLRHSKGEWAGKVLELAPWQQFIVWSLFGWKKKSDGMRRFREAYIEVARKNGKSTLLAGIGLFMLFGDGEGGAEVYTAATTQKQAKIVFDEAANMRDSSPLLKQAIVHYRNNLHVLATKSKFEPLSNESETLDGLNVHAALVDELHEHKNRALWDVLDTATGSRRQSLMFAITTAGFDRESFCWKQREHSEKILNGILNDDHFFCFVACLDGARTVNGVDIPADDWEDERNWPKANPNLGISVKLEDLQRKAKRAKEDPASQNNFLRKHLNVWTRNDTRWMPMDKWDACHGIVETKQTETGASVLISPKEAREKYAELLKGRVAYAGLDLSTTTDLSAYVLVFQPLHNEKTWTILPYFWIPEDNMHERVKRDRVPYDVWVREGFIEATVGNVIDYDFIRSRVNASAREYKVKEIAFDRANSSYLVSQLTSDGRTMVDFGQGTLSMSAPTKQLLSLTLQKLIRHLNNPVLRWMADNTVVVMNAAGDIKPDKSRSREKIDGIAASVMGLGRGILFAPKPSIYASRGVITI
jgi:phage terminase large subunit-like protein